MREAHGKSRGPQDDDAGATTPTSSAPAHLCRHPILLLGGFQQGLRHATTPPARTCFAEAPGGRFESPDEGLYPTATHTTTQPPLEAPPGIRRPGQYIRRSTAPHTTPPLRSARPAGNAAPAQCRHHTRLLTTPARPSVNRPARTSPTTSAAEDDREQPDPASSAPPHHTSSPPVRHHTLRARRSRCSRGRRLRAADPMLLPS